MKTFTLSEAKSQFGKLIELVEAGEEITLTKRGVAIAHIVRNAAMPQQQLPSLAEFRARLPQQTTDAGAFIRHLRDTDRY